MKVGIITISSAHNYGCMLQAWGLQEYVKKLGYEVDIINLRLDCIDNLYKPLNLYKGLVKAKRFRKLRAFLWQNLKTKGIRAKRKYLKFEAFIAKQLHTTTCYRSYQELVDAKVGDAYDILITGSDQVWNGAITGGLNRAFFLDFTNKPVRKISFASSVGKTVLKDYEKDFFQHYLENFDAIAVREESAKEMLSTLTNKSIDVVVDPTLLLEGSDFDNLKKRPNYNRGYILVHVINADSMVRPIAEKLSKLTGLPVIHNRSDKRYSNELGRFDDAGVEEFLGLIEQAAYVVTNSFHATVFAIIYRRKFFTIPHEKYPERMVHLLSMLELSNYLVKDVQDIPTNLNGLDYHYDKVYELLDIQRKHSQNILRNELENESTYSTIYK
ncbi:hypothetical protein acsn021_21240 [Anaerocolumna cellulosilytica]|uniref:Uncharacterized protein n=1 Tax=Anaerocolumna cellulosilytica TaxID=433286 RepID=A0A6S6R564_9FIRM|nr:polysaccharide pyruvyl transferase family protein [Anaerocolumna cellulosilytica]MBB5194232.1 hypothetical protein [Anaerocolumna cellulosilytica]BCJ94555.1 hypothetical protein acsn021_21240 [Anaerocolumna cellulosilytica]